MGVKNCAQLPINEKLTPVVDAKRKMPLLFIHTRILIILPGSDPRSVIEKVRNLDSHRFP
jgi:hypothetical protein